MAKLRRLRNRAFGLFTLGYGGGWLLGSVVTGMLYGNSRIALIAFAVATQMASIPLFLLAAKPQAQAGQRDLD